MSDRSSQKHWGPIQLDDGSTTYGWTVAPSVEPELHKRLMREQGLADSSEEG